MAPSGSTKGRALITGASAGIGEQFARVFAENGHDLILVARSEDKLKQLAAELSVKHRIEAHGLAADLLQPDAAFDLHARVADRGLAVDILVNNAGLLTSGAFRAQDTRRLLDIVELNVAALTALTSLFLPAMLERRSGRILNLASVASFQPVPMLAVYAATKAYVLSLTESLSEELRGTGVSVTALCPGMTDTSMVRGSEFGGRFEIPPMMMSSPEAVARAGYRALMAGTAIEVPGFANQLAASWVQLQPRWLVRALGGIMGRAVER